MKSIALVLFFLLFSSVSFAQIGGEDEVYLSGDRTDPTFNGGGLDKFYDFINKEFDFSKVAKAGKMITAFTIDVDGAIKNIKVIQFVDIETATEIIRVLKKAPKWQPAKRGGKPISIEIKFPLDFKSSKKEEVINKTSNEILSDSINNATQGGLNNFYRFIRDNYKMPDVSNLKGQTIVSFTINEDGTLSDFKIIKNLKYGTGEELIRVLKLTSGKWIPAMKDGKKVKSTFSLPIKIETPPD